MAVDAGKSSDDIGLVPNICRRLQRGRVQAWRSMEELPLKSSFTHRLRERRARSESPHASSSSCSPASVSSVLLNSSSFISTSKETVVEGGHVSWMKATESQETCIHVLAASEGIHREKHASPKEKTELEEASTSTSHLIERADVEHTPKETVVEGGRHVSWMKVTESQETCMHGLATSEGTHCEKHASSPKEKTELEEASTSTSHLIERADVEHTHHTMNKVPHDTSAPPNRTDDTEQACQQKDAELQKTYDTEQGFRHKDAESQKTYASVSTVLGSANDTEHTSPLRDTDFRDTDLLETPTQISSPSKKADEAEQTSGVKAQLQEMSMDTAIPSKRPDDAPHAPQQEDSELREISLHIPTLSERADDYGELTTQVKHTETQDTSTQISTAIKETDDAEHISDDIDLASQMKNMGSQNTSASICTPSENAGWQKKLQEASMHSNVIERSLQQYLQQDEVAEEEAAAMQSFIINRFLPAAKELAAEHESSITSLVSKNQAIAQSPQQSQRPPISCRMKSRAQKVPKPKGFTSSRSLQSKQQEDSVPHSMKSCGFFCLGLKSALFRVRHTVSASARSASRKKAWVPHSSNHVKVADHGTSFISSEDEGAVAQKRKATRGHKPKHQNATHISASVSHSLSSPISVIIQESPRRHAMKYAENLSRNVCTGSCDRINVACTPRNGQLGKGDLAGKQSEIMESMHDPLYCHIDASHFVDLTEPDREILWEGVAQHGQEGTCDFTSTCICDHCESLHLRDLTSENMSGNPPQGDMGGMKTKGSLAHDYSCESALQDQCDNEDNEPRFYDALSRLNSVKSTTPFYTLGSPRSQFEVMGCQAEWINDDVGFADASSHFETPRTSMSESMSVLSHTCDENEKVSLRSGKASNLSQRVGKVLKLETRVEQASIQSTHDLSCDPSHEQHESASFLKKRAQSVDFRSENFSRMRHPSLDSMSGLCLSKAIFPAKCQSNSPNALGWPFGISSYQSSRVRVSPDNTQQEKSIEKYVTGLNVPSPPLPPSPAGSWLGKAITKNALKTSPLAVLQRKDKVASARRKLDFISTDTNGERRWENVVKGSQMQLGHLRYSEELHKQHPSNLNDVTPLKL